MHRLKTFSMVLTAFGLFLVLGLSYACVHKAKTAYSEAEWQSRVEATQVPDLYAPHEKDGRFFAPWMPMKAKRFIDVMGWKLFGRDVYTKTEETSLPEVLPDTAQRLKGATGNIILWIGHNTFLVRIDGRYILTDPMFSKRALLPARKTPPALSIEELNAVVTGPVTILVSHNHYDHLDRHSMEKLPRASEVFVPKGLGKLVRKMNKNNVREMDWWDSIDLGRGTRLVCLPAQHWSMRIDQGRNRSLWAAYLVITPSATLFFGGDSGYFKGFREIGKRYPGIDYAFMATTAYQPRWFMHYQHMNIEEAVKGFHELGARFFIPTQWGTFHLGNEPAGFPGLDLTRYIRQENLDKRRFKLMAIGEILAIDPS